MPKADELETDYLVVGAGALGMSFVDSLIEHGDADVVMVDRRPGAGGHWLDAYPFVQLHQPSRFYGVDSTPLGGDRIETVGADVGCTERASGAEICGYYDAIMRHRFLDSGQVRFFSMCDYLGDRRFRSSLSGRITEVSVRRNVVDATYMASRIPSIDPPPFAVDDAVRCVPSAALGRMVDPAAAYVIVGGGKTGMDAICWLLEQGTDPDSITWICPRGSWLLNRHYFQPARLHTFEGIVLHLEAIAESESVPAVFERLESEGVVVRVDPSVQPSMMKGATLGPGELRQLRQITNVVSLGHVKQIGADRIVLDHGEIPTGPDRLHVHCAAPGLADNPVRPIFGEDGITLQLVTRVGITLSGALQGFLEASNRTIDEKNRLCRPTGMPHTPFDWLRALLAGIATELSWSDAPDLQVWLDRSRLNLISGLEEGAAASGVDEMQGRFLAAVFPALERFGSLAALATPGERSRMWDPAASGGA